MSIATTTPIEVLAAPCDAVLTEEFMDFDVHHFSTASSDEHVSHVLHTRTQYQLWHGRLTQTC